MAKLGVKDIQTEAANVIRENPGGIRYTNLVAEILKRHPETPQNTLHGGWCGREVERSRAPSRYAAFIGRRAVRRWPDL